MRPHNIAWIIVQCKDKHFKTRYNIFGWKKDLPFVDVEVNKCRQQQLFISDIRLYSFSLWLIMIRNNYIMVNRNDMKYLIKIVYFTSKQITSSFNLNSISYLLPHNFRFMPINKDNRVLNVLYCVNRKENDLLIYFYVTGHTA